MRKQSHGIYDVPQNAEKMREQWEGINEKTVVELHGEDGGADKKYWDKRAKKLVEYKREKFYTITPIPYYYERRKILLNMMKKIFSEQHVNSVLDLGCGDGEYIYHLGNGNIKFHGVDVSTEMIELASKKCNDSNNSFEISGDGVHERNNFDLAYVIAVLAHVEDNIADMLLKSAYQSLTKTGILCIFEQIAPFRMGGVHMFEEPARSIVIC